MALTFLVSETHLGGWECSDENQLLDEHPTLDAALEHLRSVAQARGQAFKVAVHYRDGWTRHATG
jgi:hypothetical protein